MLADGRTVPADETIETEVCVVGAGPAGIAIARELSQAKVEVVLLERGPDPRVEPPQNADTAINVGIPYRVGRSRMFAFGGATHRWHIHTALGDGYGRLRELDVEDFESRAWIPNSGWPIDRDQLDPFYRRARSLFDLPEPPPTEHSMNNSAFSANETVEARMFYFANPGVIAGEMRRNLENSLHALLLCNSTATEIETDRTTGAVTSVKVSTNSEHSYTVEARFFVLAGGGIENPRLLLSSRSSISTGVANRHDLVGRYFMEHPHYSSGYLIPSSTDTFVDTHSHDIFLQDGVPMQRKYGLSEDVIELNGLNRSVFYLSAEPITVKLDAVRYSDTAIQSLEASRGLYQAVRGRKWSQDATRDLWATLRGVHHLGNHVTRRLITGFHAWRGDDRYTRPYLFWIRAMAEQVPNPASRVRLGEAKDEFGVPLAELDWRLTDQDTASMRKTQELFGKAQVSAGHREVGSFLEGRERPAFLAGGNHHMGTTRMAASPRRGVVDADCKVHGHDNLFVAGSSVFPTGGYANPTLTLLALALRLSDHVAERVRRPAGIDGPSSD